jgi:hypothetical protein
MVVTSSNAKQQLAAGLLTLMIMVALFEAYDLLWCQCF